MDLGLIQILQEQCLISKSLLNHICKNPFSKTGNIHRLQGLGPGHILLRGGSIQPSSQAKLSPLTRSPPWSHFLNLRGQFPVLSQSLQLVLGCAWSRRISQSTAFPKWGLVGQAPQGKEAAITYPHHCSHHSVSQSSLCLSAPYGLSISRAHFTFVPQPLTTAPMNNQRLTDS